MKFVRETQEMVKRTVLPTVRRSNLHYIIEFVSINGGGVKLYSIVVFIQSHCKKFTKTAVEYLNMRMFNILGLIF